MAQQVYSVRLWISNSSLGGTVFTGPQVPAGFVWVVRDVRMLNTATSANSLASPMLVTAGGNANIAASPTYSSVPGVLYQWQGRAVVQAAEFLFVHTSSSNWQWAVDGYQLSLP